MRKKILLLLFSILSFGTNSFAQYHKDILGENFVQQTIQMPDDYEGKVIITIVRKEAALPTTKAILYVHGFNDYFFQKSLAEHFNDAGFNFYAVDLRKYGRSMLSNQYPFQVHNLNEYFARHRHDLADYKTRRESRNFINGAFYRRLNNLSFSVTNTEKRSPSKD